MVQQFSQMRDEGYSHDEVTRLARAGKLVRVRRGVYDLPCEVDEVERHRRLVRATLPLCAESAVVSHESAAVLWGLPLLEHRRRRSN